MAATRAPPPKPNAPSAVLPELGTYVKSKAARGEASEYNALVRALGELPATGEKGIKVVLASVFPRIFQYQLLPPNLVPMLIQLTAGPDRRLQRHAAYLLQALLGPGAAGTPSPVPNPNAASLVGDVKASALAKAWAGITAEEGNPAFQTTQMRFLAAAARGAEGQLDKELTKAVEAFLTRAVDRTLPFPDKKAQKSDVPDLQRAAFAAARASLKGNALRRVIGAALQAASSPDALAARHALAAAASAARQDATKIFQDNQGLASLVNTTASNYEASGFVFGTDPKKAVPDRARAMMGSINFNDAWARVHLARLCAAFIHADWSSTQEFVDASGMPFWRMLILLATKDKSNMVTLEAIRALFGSLPPATASLAQGGQPVPAQNEAAAGRMRMRAWTLLSLKADTAAPLYIPGMQSEESATLMGALGVRLRHALQTIDRAPLVCSACRTAGAVLEARARCMGAFAAGKRGMSVGSPEANRMAAVAIQELTGVLEGPYSAAERSCALQALLWTQLPGQPTALGPTTFLHQISTPPGAIGAGADGAVDVALLPWGQDLLDGLLAVAGRIMRAIPAATRQLLECVNAIAAAAPSKLKAEQLTEMWTMAMQLGPEGKEAALQAALTFISRAAPPIATVFTGASPKVLAQASAEEAGWAEFQRSAAWWLGEQTNPACTEFIGQEVHVPERSPDELPITGLSPGEVVALQTMRNPSLAKVITHLQHASLVLPWAARIAAAQALAKLAVRSEEPYRMQCYAILTALMAADGATSHDTIGVASVVEPALRILDSLYATRITMDNLQTAYGDDPEKWPSRVIASLRVRNDHLVQQIEQHICVLPPHSYCPIGTFGKELLAGGKGYESPESPKKLAAKEEAVVDKKAELAALQTAKSPFAAAEAQAHPGELSTDEEEAGSPSFANAPLGGEDELEKLTQKLDDQITKDAWRPKVTVQQPTFGQTTTEAAKDDFDKFLQRAADSDDESVYSADLGREESGMARAQSMAGASRRGFMLHTFEAEGADELSVEQNEQVTVLGDEIDGWFNVVSATGDQGIVPSSYVQILDSFETGFHRRRSSEAREPPTPVPVYDPFAEPDRLSELLKGPEPVATFSGHRRSTSRGSDGTGEYYGTSPAAATPRTPRTPLRRAPSRQMSLPGEDPYSSAFARASSLEPSGYDGLGPSRGSMGYGYEQEPIPEEGDDYVASYPASQQPAFTSAFAAASGLPSQASFEADSGEDERRFGAAPGLRPARMHSRTVSFADEEIPPPASFGMTSRPGLSGDGRFIREEQYTVEQFDNGGGPTTAYREQRMHQEMPEREEFNREEFYGSRAPGGGAILTGENVSPTVREEFNREEFFGRQAGGASEVTTTTTTTQVLVGDNSNAAVREEFNREEFFGRREPPEPDMTGGRLLEEAVDRDPYAVVATPSGLAPVHARQHSFSSQPSLDASHPAHRHMPSDASMISVDVPSSAGQTPGQPTPRTALFPFIGEMDDELTISKGEAFIVHSEADGWLEVTRLSDNRSGLVPVGYIQ